MLNTGVCRCDKYEIMVLSGIMSESEIAAEAASEGWIGSMRETAAENASASAGIGTGLRRQMQRRKGRGGDGSGTRALRRGKCGRMGRTR